MLQKIIRRLSNKPVYSNITPISSVKRQLELIRLKSNVLAICPDNTGLNWLGIKSGTIALFPNNFLLLQQYYSHSVYSQKELLEIINFITKLDFDKVVFRGFPAYFESFIRDLKRQSSELKIFVLYAGPASEFNESSKTENILKIITLQKNGTIEKIGFNKKGLAETINDVYQVKTGRYILKTPKIEQISPWNKSKSIKIGVLGGKTFNKNIHSQVLAALSIPTSEVHVLDKSQFSYLPQQHRIVGYNGYLDNDQFLKILASMDVNLYLAFSESWGNVITESLSQGVPCLSTINSGIFDFSEDLKEALVVQDYDNVSAIRDQIRLVYNKRDVLNPMCKEYISLLNTKAEEMLQHFLN